MPEVELSVATRAPVGAVWAFVEDMDNWAPFITGYQRHEKIDDRKSVWTVKGELGGMTRLAEFNVHITDWNGPDRVAFTLEGLDEPVTGSGELLISGTAPPVAAPAGWLARLRNWLARRLLARIFGSAPATTQTPQGGDTTLTFKLSLHAGGGTGPILNLLVAPLLHPVAEQLATRIVAAVETQSG